MQTNREILEEDIKQMGLKDTHASTYEGPLAGILFSTEEEMNLYRLAGRLKEGVDCYFEYVNWHFLWTSRVEQ